MVILNDLLASLPDGKVAHVNIDLHWTAVVVDIDGQARCGLASTLHGITRDQMMARNKANHINVAYAHTPEDAAKAKAALAAMMAEMRIEIHPCGEVEI